MFRNPDLPALVRLLERRGAYLYHACQFGDFLSYLELGGIPSRQRLEEDLHYFTGFTTDEVDQDNRVWDKVFVNMEDFGRAFASGLRAGPNTYGPIVVRMHPRALLDAADVAVCLRSAGARGFDREAESLSTVAQVDRVFWQPADAPHGTARLKYGEQLRATFPAAEGVEVSCTVPGGVLGWEHAVDVVVDPYEVPGGELVAHVGAAVRRSGVPLRVGKRNRVKRPERYQLLLQAVRERTPAIGELARTLPDKEMRSWASAIEARGGIVEKNYVRWADYLRRGTLERLETLARTRIAVPALYEYAPSLGDDDDYDEWDEDDFDPYEEERALLHAELDDFREGWERANDEGWFYSDADGDEDEVAVDPWE